MFYDNNFDVNKALEDIRKNQCCYYVTTDTIDKNFAELIKLRKENKKLKKKIKKLKTEYFAIIKISDKDSIIDDEVSYNCPNCGYCNITDSSYHRDSYCADCGAKLKWEV